jgi:hypothetical protein
LAHDTHGWLPSTIGDAGSLLLPRVRRPRRRPWPLHWPC